MSPLSEKIEYLKHDVVGVAITKKDLNSPNSNCY